MAKPVKLVRMTRSVEAAAGGPTAADVHPDEIENYRAAGFVPVKAEPAQAEPAQAEPDQAEPNPKAQE